MDRFRRLRDGGSRPDWRDDGKELYYVGSDANMMAVPVGTTGRFVPQEPQALFPTGALNNNIFSYAVTSDGKRFLLNARPQRPSTAPITVVVNWPAAIQK